MRFQECYAARIDADVFENGHKCLRELVESFPGLLHVGNHQVPGLSEAHMEKASRWMPKAGGREAPDRLIVSIGGQPDRSVSDNNRHC